MSSSATHLVQRLSSTRTGGKNKHVEFVLFFLRFYPFRRDLEDGTCVNVDEVDVVLIEDLVEMLFLAWTLATKRMGWDCGRQQFLLFRVLDSLTDFLPPECIRSFVAVLVSEEVLIICNYHGL